MQIHPACDLFMRGVRYCEVVKVGRKWVQVFSPITKTKHKVTLRNLRDEHGNSFRVK